MYLSFRKTCSEIYYHISLTPNTYQAMFCTVFPLFCTSTFHYWWWSWARVTKGCVSIRHLTPDFPYILMNICIVLKMVYCMKTGVLGTCRCNPRVYFLAFSHFLKYMIALCKKKLSDNVLFSISSFLYNMVCTISRRNVQYSLGYFNKKSHVFQQILIQSENHASNKGKSLFYPPVIY